MTDSLIPVESPYLPGTTHQYAWDSTSLGQLKTCPRLYQLSQIEGWTSREESVHLRFGIEYHRAMQDYDLERAEGIIHSDAVHDVCRALIFRTQDWDPDHPKKNRETLLRSVIWYLDKFKDNAEQTYIKADGKPAVELSFKFELPWEAGPGYPYLLAGHLDKVITINGPLYVRDYKYVFSFWNQHWEPDNQMTLYSLAAKIVLKAPINGVLVDMVTLKTKDGFIYPEFQSVITQRTSDQTDEWVEELRFWFELAERYSKLNYWPMNDTSCNKYGGCRFREICSKSPSVRETFLESNFKRREEPWNPLKPRE